MTDFFLLDLAAQRGEGKRGGEKKKGLERGREEIALHSLLHPLIFFSSVLEGGGRRDEGKEKGLSSPMSGLTARCS